MDREAWHVAILGVAKSWTQVTELNRTESLELNLVILAKGIAY